MCAALGMQMPHVRAQSGKRYVEPKRGLAVAQAIEQQAEHPSLGTRQLCVASLMHTLPIRQAWRVEEGKMHVIAEL